MKNQAREGRKDALSYSNKIHDIQADLRDITQQLMSIVSELSMYKAMTIKLEEERNTLKDKIDRAVEAIDQNARPQEELIDCYYREERDRLLDLERIENLNKSKLLQSQDVNQLQTTAEPRPNAYLPEDLPIPKPYGNFAPFKPTTAGSSMRHIKKPLNTNIEI